MRVASAIFFSMWSVKNWKGASSPYSSPMKSIGVNGLSRVQSAASGRAGGGIRSPSARLPTWSWFWEQTTNWAGARSGAGAPTRFSRTSE